MGVEVMLDRLAAVGMDAKVVGDDRSAVLIVDGVEVGTVIEDRVHLYR